jgi:hypothetical protein
MAFIDHGSGHDLDPPTSPCIISMIQRSHLSLVLMAMKGFAGYTGAGNGREEEF